MTAVVSKEHAKATWLLGVAGLVILAVAVVMMACAAPSLARPRPHAAMAGVQYVASGPSGRAAAYAGYPGSKGRMNVRS